MTRSFVLGGCELVEAGPFERQWLGASVCWAVLGRRGLVWVCARKLGHLIVPCIALILFPAPRVRRVVSQCPICLDLLERPGITDCLHVFW